MAMLVTMSGSFRLATAAVVALVAGCATAPSAVDRSTLESDLASQLTPTLRPDVARPRTPQEAGAMLALATSYLEQERRAEALPLLVALRGTDFLTDRGQANLYWLIAEAALGVDEAVRLDALGGFVIASGLLPDEPDQRERRRHARAALLAHQVRHKALGRSADDAIVVLSTREADVVVASLGCGTGGDGHYVERRLPGVLRDDELPRARRLLCTENGDELTLWFRLEP